MDQKSGKPSQKRRAILQGSLAAPVVLTVSSPSAAQVTTLGRCMANIRNLPEGMKPAYLVEADDTWFRKQVPVVKLTLGNSSQQMTDWVFFDEALQDYVTVATPHTRLNIGPLSGGWGIAATGTPRWGLVWVHEGTKSISTETRLQPPGGYTAVTDSCWTSFKNSPA